MPHLLWLLIAGVLLALERICYVVVARAPGVFSRWCARAWVAWVGEPVAVVQALFVAFKALQTLVFVGWCYAHGDRWWRPSDQDELVLTAAALAVAIGQFLVWSVFFRLGREGVFYGDRLGHIVPWCEGFPFSLLTHPQYVGTVLTIWGFFLATRFPHEDWYALPVLETFYYVAGAALERPGPWSRLEERVRYGQTGTESRTAVGDGRIGRAAPGRYVGGGESAATLSHDLG